MRDGVFEHVFECASEFVHACKCGREREKEWMCVYVMCVCVCEWDASMDAAEGRECGSGCKCACRNDAVVSSVSCEPRPRKRRNTTPQRDVPCSLRTSAYIGVTVGRTDRNL